MEMCEVLIVDIVYWFFCNVYIIPVPVSVIIILRIPYILFYILFFVIQLSFFYFEYTN